MKTARITGDSPGPPRDGSLSVAARLGISSPETVVTKPYYLGSEPVTSNRRARGPKTPTGNRADLDQYIEHAIAGVDDSVIAKRAKRSIAQVRAWRLAQGVRRASGRPTAQARIHAKAVELLGRSQAPVAVPVRQSPVLGRWEPPLYVLRDPLDYAKFVAIVDFAASKFSMDDITAGLGLRKVDVVIAARLGERLRHAQP